MEEPEGNLRPETLINGKESEAKTQDWPRGDGHRCRSQPRRKGSEEALNVGITWMELPYRSGKVPPANPTPFTLQHLGTKALVVTNLFIQHKKTLS